MRLPRDRNDHMMLGAGGLLLAATTRIIGAFEPSIALMYVAALAWFAAFAGFCVVYGPLLLSRPPDSKIGC